MDYGAFLEQFEALTVTPGGLDKLRALIIQLGILGRLTNNDQTPPVSIGFPLHWKLLQLREIADIVNGNSINAEEKSAKYEGVEGRPYIATKDVDKATGAIDYENGVCIPLAVPGFRIAKANAVLICAEGGSAGRKIGKLDREVCFGNKLFAVHPSEALDSDFLLRVLQSEYFFENFSKQMTGIIGGTSLRKFKEIRIPVPDLLEQKKIAARIGDILQLCTTLGKGLSASRIATHRLAEIAFERLIADTKPGTSSEWQFVSKAFEALVDDGAAVDRLRQAILDLATRGALTTRISSDGSADDLLRSIAEERAQLNLPQVPELDETIDGLPKTWRTASLSGLCVFGPKNGYSPKPVSHITKTKTLTLSAVTTGTFNPAAFKYVDETIEATSHLWVEPGDLLLQRANSIEYVGVSAIFTGERGDFIYPDLMMRLKFSGLLDNRFMHMALNSTRVRRFFRDNASGTSGSMPKINQATVKSAVLPVPPLEEQERIAAQYGALMSWCDTLEKQLSKRHLVGGQIFEALIASLIPRYSPDGGGSSEPTRPERPNTERSVHPQTQQAAPAGVMGKFQEAVLVGAIVRRFYDAGGEPVGNFRLQKAVYFARRYMREPSVDAAFLKKVAGPYSPSLKYSGGIAVAKQKEYVREARGRFGFGHVTGVQAQELESWLDKYPSYDEAARWVVEKFKLRKNEEWEKLATVDYAIRDIESNGRTASPEAILGYIASAPEWQAKVAKLQLTEFSVESAAMEVRALFAECR